MTKKKNTTHKSANEYPKVSVCTPTYNRRPFIENMFACFRNQTYPMSRVEWIIIDDGTDKIGDLVDNANIPQIKYFAMDTKMTLGAKRNYMHTKATGEFIVYFDDDDYYPPSRISHAVERLQETPSALIAGTSEIFIYFKPLLDERPTHFQENTSPSESSAAAEINERGQMVQFGPYPSMPRHTTAGTFAFRRTLLEQTRYNESDSLAEERDFLKNFTLPMVSLDSQKTILVFSHPQNTFDKRFLLNSPWSDVMQKSDLKVTDFIQNKNEQPILDFFMYKVDKVLQTYTPGKIEQKPDVIKHLATIINQQKQPTAEQLLDQVVTPNIMSGDHALTAREIINAIQQLHTENETLKATIANAPAANSSTDATANSSVEPTNQIIHTENESLKATIVPATQDPTNQIVHPEIIMDTRALTAGEIVNIIQELYNETQTLKQTVKDKNMELTKLKLMTDLLATTHTLNTMPDTVRRITNFAGNGNIMSLFSDYTNNKQKYI
jgi:glycosyltransferase involved in cell wall biosynthesis